MARLLGPDNNSRLAYIPGVTYLGSARGLTAVVYSDAAGTVLADIATYDGTGTPGAAIPGSALTIPSDSLVPLFWLPDGVDRVWVRIDGGPPIRADADYDPRIDGKLVAASNLSDLASASSARTNLGLGGAALLNVGTTAGTVAAGDDSRIALPRPHHGADYTITVDRTGPAPVYTAKDATGAVVASVADTSTTSGLKSVLGTVLPADARDKVVQFGAGRFHFLDAPLGTEAWASVEDHAVFARLDSVTFAGLGDRTIISNYTNQTAATDTEPFDFTNCRRLTIRDLVVEGCGRYKSTTDAIDLDSGEECKIVNVIIRSSRARGVVIDGGNAGQSGSRNRIRGVTVKGSPAPAQLDLVSGGSLTADTAYTYAVGWRCNGLGVYTGVTGASSGTTATLAITSHPYAVGDTVNVTGMDVGGYNGTYTVTGVPDADHITYTTAGSDLGAGTGATVVGPDVTKPSEPVTITTTSGSKKVRIYLEAGPYSCVGRVVYRYDGSSWKTVTTVADNTTLSYLDDGSGTPPAATFTTKSTIPDAAVELLGASDNTIDDLYIDGTGDGVNGQNQYGLNIVRKTLSGVAVHADRNLVGLVQTRRTNSHAVRIAGGRYNTISKIVAVNPGTSAVKAQGIRLEGLSGANTDYNNIGAAIIVDDRTAASPDGTAGINNAISVTATNNPTGNLIAGPLVMAGYTSAAAISDSGTATLIEPAEKTIYLLVDGDLATGTTKKGFYFACPWPATIKRARLYAGTAPASQAIIVDINKNGSTIWSTQGNRVQVAAGANAGTQTSFNTTDLAAGDVLTVDVDQVGTGTPGSNLAVELTVLASRVY